MSIANIIMMSEIKEFLSKRFEKTDMEDFCFYLRLYLNSNYEYDLLIGESIPQKARDLTKKSHIVYDELEELQIMLTCYCVQKEYKPSVLKEHNLHRISKPKSYEKIINSTDYLQKTLKNIQDQRHLHLYQDIYNDINELLKEMPMYFRGKHIHGVAIISKSSFYIQDRKEFKIFISINDSSDKSILKKQFDKDVGEIIDHSSGGLKPFPPGEIRIKPNVIKTKCDIVPSNGICIQLEDPRIENSQIGPKENFFKINIRKIEVIVIDFSVYYRDTEIGSCSITIDLDRNLDGYPSQPQTSPIPLLPYIWNNEAYPKNYTLTQHQPDKISFKITQYLSEKPFDKPISQPQELPVQTFNQEELLAHYQRASISDTISILRYLLKVLIKQSINSLKKPKPTQKWYENQLSSTEFLLKIPKHLAPKVSTKILERRTVQNGLKEPTTLIPNISKESRTNNSQIHYLLAKEKKKNTLEILAAEAQDLSSETLNLQALLTETQCDQVEKQLNNIESQAVNVDSDAKAIAARECLLSETLSPSQTISEYATAERYLLLGKPSPSRESTSLVDKSIDYFRFSFGSIGIRLPQHNELRTIQTLYKSSLEVHIKDILRWVSRPILREFDLKKPIPNFIGIDLGMIYSAIAIPKKLKGEYFTAVKNVTLIKDDNESYVIPSIIAADQNNNYIIQNAKELIGQQPAVLFAKRLIGEKIKLALGNRYLNPEDLVAEILRYLRRKAEKRIGSIAGAIITVPAYFNELQKQATREAAKQAELGIVELLEEPLAAVLAYYDGKPNLPSTIMACNLGGGPFEVAILQREDKDFEIKTADWNPRLSGYNFDKPLAGKIVSWLKNKGDDCDINLNDLSSLETCELMVLAESIKIALSKREYFVLHKQTKSIYSRGKPVEINMNISRDIFENLIHPDIDQTIEFFNQTIKNSEIDPHKIEEIILFGGCLNIPLLAQRLQDAFILKPKIIPDLPVAAGAAIKARDLVSHIEVW